MNKGFTLIELLAVILILAILALIAVPIVTGIIRDAKERSDNASRELYINAVVSTIASRNSIMNFDPQQCQILEEKVILDEYIYEQGDLLCDGIYYLKIDTTGNRPTGGTLKIKKGRVIESTINYD